MRTCVRALLLACCAALGVGCSDGTKKGDPKPGAGYKEDPRLKPAGASGGAASQGSQPKANVKGD